jgi:hypothetical protein
VFSPYERRMLTVPIPRGRQFPRLVLPPARLELRKRRRLALELFATGLSYREVGERLGRLDGTGAIGGTRAAQLVRGAFRDARVRPDFAHDGFRTHDSVRDLCALLLASKRASLRFRKRYRELLSEMKAVEEGEEPIQCCNRK